jgi:hypothetical protein
VTIVDAGLDACAAVDATVVPKDTIRSEDGIA